MAFLRQQHMTFTTKATLTMTITRCIIALLLVALLGLYVIASSENVQQSIFQYFESIEASLTPTTWLLILIISACCSALGLPRQLIALAYGHVLGGLSGAMLASAVAVTACVMDFYLARRWLRSWLKSRYPHRLEQLDQLLTNTPFLKALALRLFPSGSNLITSLLGGASSVSAPAFISGSALGYLPQMFLFAYLGAGASWAAQHRDRLSMALFAATFALALVIYLRHRRRQSSY